jgi:hypothetical protein
VRDKRVQTKDGVDVDLKFEVVPGRNAVKMEAPDPADPSRIVRKRVTIGPSNGPAGAGLPQDATAMQSLVDAEAVKFAEELEQRRVVSALLKNVT